jgi:hypothetical protein
MVRVPAWSTQAGRRPWPPNGSVRCFSVTFPTDPPIAEAAPAIETAPDAVAVPETTAVDTGFDRDRVLGIIDRLEREVAIVEAAMVHVESGAHDAAEIALASLGELAPS